MSSTLPKVIGGCFGCLGLLIVSAIVFVSLFYLEEDWRGAHELAAAKARWAAAGYSLNAADCVPPPVPDERNLAALPVFRLEPDPRSDGKLADVRLRDAVDADEHGGTLNDPSKNEGLATLVAQAYVRKFPSKTPPGSSVAQLEELYPLLVDLRTAAATRPEFRLNMDYMSEPAIERSFVPVTRQLAVAKLIAYHAQLALRENQQQMAMDDISLDFQIARGVGKCPSLVSGLVSLGVAAIARREVVEGLERHAWNDGQLARLQQMQGQFDCLSGCQFAMRSETAMFSLPMYVWLKKQSSNVKWVMEMSAGADDESNTNRFFVKFCRLFWANGWWDMNAAQTANVMLDAVHCVDLKTRRVDPTFKQQIDDKLQKAKESTTKIAPWNLIYLVAAGPMTNAVEKFAQGQAQLDEDRIVCGLERYRLAHGVYPPSLGALVPACIGELPHDIMNGEPYRYRLNADGTFLLYSVGWNQVDNGGRVVYKKENPTAIDYEQGDWVWPMFVKK